MAKTFLTYQQQLHILEHDKQLAIPDPDYAKKMLEEISYYSLIGGYKSLFKHNASNKYAHGIQKYSLDNHVAKRFVAKYQPK